MNNNNIKKLVNYSFDCVRQSIKANSFNNLKNDENILYIDDFIFNIDNKKIIEIMQKYALNKTTMSLLYSDLFIINKNKKINSPLIYYDAELKKEENNKIKLIFDEENKNINIGVIASLINTDDEEKINYIIEQLTDIDGCDIIQVLKGLINNIDDCEFIENQKTIILAKMPESTAGLLNELRIIANEY